MSSSQIFKSLVEKGNDSGEVIYSDRFLARVSGLDKVMMGSVVVFEDGSNGLVESIYDDYIEILNLNTEVINIGSLVVVKDEEIKVKVSKEMLGRIVDPLGKAVDGLGMLQTEVKKLCMY